ncbi:MAG: Hpt domain-containing protein [Lachnospiraceae bacterium]|nr:Hpt domain-containing protein [Lachnospiraceae bacterium]
MDYDLNKLEECGVDTGVGIDYTGSRDKYIQALKHYYKAYESNRARLTQALSSMDISEYTIAVHSLKSNSRMIGAGELASRFEALEMAARSGNASVIITDTPAVLASYDILIKQLKPIGVDIETDTVNEITAEEAHKISEELLEALEEYDDELSARLVSRLSGYPFDTGKRDMLDEAREYIGEFMYDEAAAIVKDISASID